MWRLRSPHHCCRGFFMRTSEPKPHYITKLASVLSIPKFETWLRKMLRTSESGHSPYFAAESCFSIAIASCTVVMNWAGKMMVEFFSIEISAIVCRVRS